MLLKLAFASCELEWQTGIRSPSGHAGLGIFVYGSWAALVLGTPRGGRPLALAAAALILAIAVSRVTLHAHTPVEVLIGAAVGSVWLWSWMARHMVRPDLPAAVTGRLVAATLLIQWLGSGVQIPAESWVMDWGRQAHTQGLCGAPVRSP